MTCDCASLESKLSEILSLVKDQNKRIAALEKTVAKLEVNDNNFVNRLFDSLKGNTGRLAVIVGGLTIGGIQLGYGLKEAAGIRQALNDLSSEVGGKIARVEKGLNAAEVTIDVTNNRINSIERTANNALSTAGGAAATAGVTAATVVSLKMALAALGATVALLAPLFTLTNEVRKIRNDLYNYVDRGDELNARLILNIQQSTKNRTDQLNRELDDIAAELARLRADLKADVSRANQKAQQALDAIPALEYRITVVQRDLTETKTRLETELRRVTELNQSQYTSIITEIRRKDCSATIVKVPTPYPVPQVQLLRIPTPYPVDRPVPFPVDRPVPFPVITPCPPPATITKIHRVPVPTPFPVTNTITKETTRIVPQIVTVTPDCPDPCPPCPDYSADIEEIKNRTVNIDNQLQDQQCPECPDPIAIAAVPEYWQIPVGADRPQLVVHYCPIDPATGKPDRSKSRYPLNIPHWNGSTAWKLLPRWEKGNFQARAVLKDNSRIILYAKDEFEAERAMKKIFLFVKKEMLEGVDTYIGEVNANFKKFKCTPLNARYFPQGRLTEIPDYYEIEKK